MKLRRSHIIDMIFGIAFVLSLFVCFKIGQFVALERGTAMLTGGEVLILALPIILVKLKVSTLYDTIYTLAKKIKGDNEK